MCGSTGFGSKTTWEFIQNVGINVNPETGEKTAVNVSFSFIQGGRLVQLNIPLLTIVPIPYIAIREVDINFKANISASSSTTAETNESVSKIGFEGFGQYEIRMLQNECGYERKLFIEEGF